LIKFPFLRDVCYQNLEAGKKVNNVNKLGGQHKMYQRGTVLDVA
jgi:hypothetical protein